MDIPSVAFIGQALDIVTTHQPTAPSSDDYEHAIAEFRALGNARLARLSVGRLRTHPIQLQQQQQAPPGTLIRRFTPIELGYLMGLETMRIYLRERPDIIAAGIEL
jgi:hypothetical protein